VCRSNNNLTQKISLQLHDQDWSSRKKLFEVARLTQADRNHQKLLRANARHKQSSQTTGNIECADA
jgi:hypothetical protein